MTIRPARTAPPVRTLPDRSWPARLLAALLTLLTLLLPAAALAQQPVATPPAPVILISIDGFRSDYLDRGLTPRLSAMAARGVRGSIRPSFPTKTFPNHYALVTGRHPDRNGIVGNSMIDPRRPGQIFSIGDAKQALDPFWWEEAEPVWVTAEKAGVRSGTMYWPGSEVPWKGQRPSDWFRFDFNLPGTQRVMAVLDWMRRPAAIRPRLVTLYFDTVDTAGHRFGPQSPELNAAVTEVDTLIGQLADGLAEMGVAANIIVVADHGMAATDEARVIQLDDLIDKPSYIAVEAGPYAAIEPVTGTDRRVHDALLKPHPHMQCMEKEKLPERLHYGKNPRVAAIICLAQPGWVILSGTPQYPVKGGAHGWDNGFDQMLAVLVASGPAFAAPVTTGVHANVEVYPLVARLAGVTPLDSDADGSLLGALFAGTPMCDARFAACKGRTIGK